MTETEAGKKQDYEELDNRIWEIPGSQGWWKLDSFVVYFDVGKKMMEGGTEIEEIIKTLTSLYWAAAECYGG